MTLSGVFTALITPFNSDGSVDWAAYERLVERQVSAGVAGVVPVGTTGESPTLTTDEKQRAIADAVRIARGRCLVYAGTGSNSTADSVAATRWAQAAGCDGCLVVTPYYNKPTQVGQQGAVPGAGVCAVHTSRSRAHRAPLLLPFSQAGLIAHLTAIAAVGLPVMLYNVPGRAGVALSVATIAALARVPGIVALKDAGGSVDGTSDALAATAGTGMAILSGDDGLALPMMAVGATGVVSVASNVVPERMVALVAAAARGDMAAARAEHFHLLPLIRALFVETNPVPIKRAMELVGLCGGAVRLPLAALASTSEAILNEAMRSTGLQ